MQEIHQLRIEAKAQHKENLLRLARSGDCRAIAHMRSSAAGGQSEGSYVQRAGGKDQAATQLFSFYQAKYSAPPDLCPSAPQVQALEDRCRALPVASVTLEEIQQALQGARHGVSAGLDGVTYEGIQYLLQQDKQGRIPHYFTQLIRGDRSLPDSWKKGRIVLLAKTARPSQPKDLRPICLTPVLCRVFSKVLMRRVHKTAPEYSGQIGCRPGVQAADGVMAAQSTLQLLKQVKGAAYVAKIDIRAAFDSLSQASVLAWLLRCQPAKECEVLYKLLSGTRVELSLAGQTRSIDLCRGLMQGTAYSADVFSRVMDHFLSPLSARFDELFPGWTQPNLGLPHFIIYADDIMLFADTSASLQFKLQEVVDVLATIGLSVNPDKSRVMSLHDGSHPGIWIRGRALPLQVESALVFLGIPLAHTNNVQSIMSHLMRKTSNAYYGFKRVMDAGEAPISVRLHIFETFITAKWAWASPVMIPTRTMLRRLEAAKTTFLLSLFRVPTDPLLTWVENVVSRRRAVKTVCKHNGGPDWRVTWLRRLWQYLGHLSRTPHLQPMKHLLHFCSSARIGPELRPAWLSDLIIRRVQRVYATWPWAAEIPYWEQFAQDRTQWNNHCTQWVNHWIDTDVEGLATFEYLYDRQLLVLKTKKGLLDCMLRPSKDFFEEPYGVAMHVIQPACLNNPGLFLWGKTHGNQCMILCMSGSHLNQVVLVQVHASNDTLLARSIALLRLAYKVLGICEHFGREGNIVLPPQYLRRAIFHRHVPLPLLADATEALNLLDRQGVQRLFLEPPTKEGSRWSRLLNSADFVPQHSKYLVRTLNFSHAYFCEGAQQLTDALRGSCTLFA